MKSPDALSEHHQKHLDSAMTAALISTECSSIDKTALKILSLPTDCFSRVVH
jgi:hypothetical protein